MDFKRHVNNMKSLWTINETAGCDVKKVRTKFHYEYKTEKSAKMLQVRLGYKLSRRPRGTTCLQ